MILLGLLFYLWFDSKKWTYLKGYTTKKREKRTTSRAKWITKELINLGSAFIKLGQLLSFAILACSSRRSDSLITSSLKLDH